MRKLLLVSIIIFIASTGCKTIKDAMDKEAANREMPAKLNGTWNHKGYLSYKLSIDNKDFKLQVYDKSGKELRKFQGIIKVVDNKKNFVAPQLIQLFQNGKNLTGSMKGRVYYKPFYYKELTDNSVKIYILNGMTAAKFLRDHDEDAKLDRKYNEFKR